MIHSQHDRELIDRLADLLEYPGHDWSDRLDACERLVATAAEPIASSFVTFRDALPTALDEVQERYVRTFELAPDSTLELGYHLFGETYKRGEFLAHLREEEAPFDLGQEHQLPDYLPVMMRLLTRIEHDELRRDLLGACMLPAVATLVTALEKKEGPYAHLLAACGAALEECLKREVDAMPEGASIAEPAGTTVQSCSGAMPGCAMEASHA